MSFSPHYFKEVKISALALLKMVMHARSGGNLEIMGLLQGKVYLLVGILKHKPKILYLLEVCSAADARTGVGFLCSEYG